MHPDPQINIEPPTKSQKRGIVVTSEKEKRHPTTVTMPYRNLSSTLPTL